MVKKDEMGKDTAPQKLASEPLENQGLLEPKSDLPKAVPFWEQVNEVTWKLTDGTGTNTPASYGKWAPFRTTKALAWLEGIGKGLWVARYRKTASKPMKLSAAKRYALDMVKGVCTGVKPVDPIADLNRAAVPTNDWLPDIEPDLIAYIRHVETGFPLPSTVPTESGPAALQGDDYPLTYDADGDVELPACLDRRKPKLEVAA
jgi:hypothetical protein